MKLLFAVLASVFLSGCAVVFQRGKNDPKTCFPSWGIICSSLMDTR